MIDDFHTSGVARKHSVYGTCNDCYHFRLNSMMQRLVTGCISIECRHPLVELPLQQSNSINIAYSIEALQDLIEEEKQEALTDLGDHYRCQLQSLQEHITALQHKLIEAERKVSITSIWHVFSFEYRFLYRVTAIEASCLNDFDWAI